ncbi:MAG: hypothetical protein AB1523_16480 [Bacillota bacterium]
MAFNKQEGCWICVPCKVSVWPYVERVEKEVRRLMAPSAGRKKGSGGKRRSRFKTKKPGMKLVVPWYQRY